MGTFSSKIDQILDTLLFLSRVGPSSDCISFPCTGVRLHY